MSFKEDPKTEDFQNQLSHEELDIIREEENTLKKLIELAPGDVFVENREEILSQIFNLRETIDEAHADDLPQLTEQLTRLTLLVNQGDRSGVTGVNLQNPYFAHMRLQEEELTRDIFLGTQIYRSPDSEIQIIDWKSSPIALIYFRYDLGDEYEEEIGHRTFEGEVVVKRILKVTDGQLVKIQQDDLLLVKNKERKWQREDIQKNLLKGGSGTAIRPENTKTINPKLGITPSGGLDKQKLLPEITALIDPEQFEVITQPTTGIVAIQGTAGSGKTTVALHRVAWLHFQDQKRFKPGKMMVMVFNRALANYISLVLPSLGVRGVAIDFFENWVSQLRFRIFAQQLPKKYSNNTPVTVIRFKKHPALLEIIKQFIADKQKGFFSQIEEIVKKKQIPDFPLSELRSLPFVECLYTFSNWLVGRSKFMNKSFQYPGDMTNLMQRVIGDIIDSEGSRKEMVLQLWEELFSDFEFLKSQCDRLAPNEFTHQEYDEIIQWLKRQYILRQAEQKQGPIKANDVQEEATLDNEDDPILVLFYQHLIGNKISRNERIPDYPKLIPKYF